jgi:hypothetical protein
MVFRIKGRHAGNEKEWRRIPPPYERAGYSEVEELKEEFSVLGCQFSENPQNITEIELWM